MVTTIDMLATNDDWVHNDNWSVTDVVTLDVGGTLFKTTVSTLVEKSTYFKTMFHNMIKDTTKPIFIDRDPDLFKYILSYLRDHKYSFDMMCSPNIDREFRKYGVEIPYGNFTPLGNSYDDEYD